MPLSQSIPLLGAGEFWLFLLLAIAVALGSFYFSFRSLRRARIIEDTPTARVRSAQQGYVELSGEAQPFEGTPLLAPLTGTPCCWYRFKIERRSDKRWRTLEGATSEQPLLLRDPTGSCIIDPQGAEVTTTDKRVWFGHSRRPPGWQGSGRERPQSGWQRVGEILNQDIGPGGRYRYTEQRIHAGDPLYAIGHFKSHDELDSRRERKQQVIELLRQWKADQSQLLARFDRNGDGRIDLQEWEQARRTAQQEASQQHRQQQSGRLLHTLSSAGPAHQPFLISTLPQFHMVKRFRWWAGGTLLLFFIAGTTAVWMLSARLAV